MTIVSSYSTNLPRQKGTVHNHTTNSDGDKSPSEMLTQFKLNGCSFGVITDHDFVTHQENIEGIAQIIGCEVSHADLTQNPEEGFHFGVIGVGSNCLAHGTPYALLQDLTPSIVSDDAFVVMNHSSWLKYQPGATTLLSITDAEFLKFIGKYHAVEIRTRVNYLDGDAQTRYGCEDSIVQWDRLLGLGYRLNAVCVDDAHTTGGTNRGWLSVFASTVDSRTIVNALIAGNYYSLYNNDPQQYGALPNVDLKINSILIQGRTVVIEVDEACTIQFYGGFDGEHSILLQESSCGSYPYTAHYTPPNKTGYIRAEICTINNSNKVAYTNPFYTEYVPPPILSFTSTQNSTFYPSVTLQGVCNNTTNYIKLWLNDATKFVLILPENNTWSCHIPYLVFGDNSILVRGYNSLTGQYVDATYDINYSIPVATEVRSAVPFIMTSLGLRQVYPRALVNGKLQQVRCKIGLYSSAIPLTGVEANVSIGQVVPITPSNSAQLTGAELSIVVGSLTPSLSYTRTLTGVEVNSEIGNITTPTPLVGSVTGVEVSSELGSLNPYVHTPIDNDVTGLSLTVLSYNYSGATLLFTIPDNYTASRVYLSLSAGYSGITNIYIQDSQRVYNLINATTGWYSLPIRTTAVRLAVESSTIGETASITKITY